MILAGLFVWFHFVLGGDYLPAWGLFFVVCIITLYILSIPRYILLDDAALEIHCIVDLTRIHIEDIELIRRIERSEFRRLWPLLGSYGFWGYYGYYFSFREWTLYKVYAAERNNLVLIEDIYEDTYIVSCDDPDGLIAFVSEARDRKRPRYSGTRPGRSRNDRSAEPINPSGTGTLFDKLIIFAKRENFRFAFLCPYRKAG